MPITSRVVAVAVGLVILLSGCGGGGDAGQPQGQTRTVTDASGASVEVPENAQRVVTLHYAGTQAMIDLGRTPVGQANFQPDGVPENLIDQLNAIPVITGPDGAPDSEAIANLNPDLILAANTIQPNALDQLKSIAPVYQFTLRGADRANWEIRVDELSQVFNESDKATQLRDGMAAREEKIKNDYADVIGGKTVAAVGAFTDNTFYVWGSDNMSGTLLLPLGFAWSKDEDAAVAEVGGNEPEGDVSLEKLQSSLNDADVIFYTTDMREKPNKMMQAVLDNEGYKKLPAAKAKQSYPFGKTTIAGYQDANYSLDLVEDALKDMRNKKKG